MPKKKKMTAKELKAYKQKWVKSRAKLEKSVGVVRRKVRGGKYKKGTTVTSKAKRGRGMTKTELKTYKTNWVKADRAKKKKMGLALRQIKGKWKWVKKQRFKKSLFIFYINIGNQK